MKSSSRDRILDAAEEIVLKKGAKHMTMDAVASKAGVSKGGLMYHFPSQRDFLRAMLKRFVDRMEKRLDNIRSSLPASPVREIKAYILTWSAIGEDYRSAAMALLAALTREPQLLQTIRKKNLKNLTRIIKTSPNPEHMMLLSLATEGIWMSALLGLSPFSKSQCKRIKNTLLRLADDLANSTMPRRLPQYPRGQGKTEMA